MQMTETHNNKITVTVTGNIYLTLPVFIRDYLLPVLPLLDLI